MELKQAEARLRLIFLDKTLLQRALTHRSYINENPDFPLEDNERLEFLGDAVLDFIVGELLYHRFPEMKEGQLTNLRSALVRTETLARFAGEIGLGECLQMGKGEQEAGGRQRPAILCGAFEALVGALYLDQGIEATRQFLMPILEPAIQQVLSNDSNKDPKSLLQELAQGEHKITPTYRTISEHGPDHAKQFTVEALLAGVAYGQGTGFNKQQAAQAAAQAALKRLQVEIDQKKAANRATSNAD